MIRIRAATAAMLLGVVAAGSPAYAAKCVMAGGESTNPLPDVAKFMANAALGNSISGAGMKAVGKSSMTCKTDVVLTTCVAKQKACK